MPSHEIEKWISSDDIVIDAEENVFNIILRWIDHDKSERSAKFSELFRHVRLKTISCDFLLKHVVTNALVRESSNCLDRVTDALNWIMCSTDCDVNVPRPHSPRKSLERDVIVITDFFGDHHTCFYLPATDECFRLPAIEVKASVKHIVSFRKTLFVVTDDITRSQCYDPDLNRWSLAPWTKLGSMQSFNEEKLENVLVVENQICFIVAVRGVTRYFDCYTPAREVTYRPTALWRYNFDSNSLSPLINWVEKADFCAVAVDRYIYVIGGRNIKPNERSTFGQQPLSECARFNTEAEEWQKIAPLNVGRTHACGVCKNKKIFVAGGQGKEGALNSCEVYSILTDEWEVIARLTRRRTLGRMVLVDETLYVLGGRTLSGEFQVSTKLECCDHEKNEWNEKAIIPFRNVTTREKEHIRDFFKGCSLRVFYGVLNNLESIDHD